MASIYCNRILEAVESSTNPVTKNVLDSIIDTIKTYSERRQLVYYMNGGGTYSAGIVMGQCAVLCQLLNDEGGDFNGPNICGALYAEYASHTIDL